MPSRIDNVTDPALAADLLLARHGQAFWSRTLNDLRDAEFDAPSLLPGWSRRRLIAHVGLHARATARLVERSARTGLPSPLYASEQERDDDIDFGATLPPEALRHLAAHASVHLNVEWRDLPDQCWSVPVRTPDGRSVSVAETVHVRASELWLHAIDLATGAGFDDLPRQIRDRVAIADDHGRRRLDYLCPDLDTNGIDHVQPSPTIGRGVPPTVPIAEPVAALVEDDRTLMSGDEHVATTADERSTWAVRDR